MHRLIVIRILGAFLMMYSLSLVPPLIIGLVQGDGTWRIFAETWVILVGVGAVAWYLTRNRGDELRMRDGFLVVTSAWWMASLAGALPFVMADVLSVTFTEGVFETASGLTTTGSTVITGLDQLPASILYYRSQLHWLGGMGIIVLAVAILPLLRIGGMQLYRAETPGATKDAKLTPRIRETAKALWLIYVIITVLCAASYWLAGMGLFDAITHSFATVATGGFSTHDASIGYFDSALIEWVAITFMALGGINFALHFVAWRNLSARTYYRDPELRTYVGIMLAGGVVATCILLLNGIYDNPVDALRHGFFQVVSFMTTTGFVTDLSYLGLGLLPWFLLFLGNIGGCGGSTAGGIKNLRALLLYRLSRREIKRLIHPSAYVPATVRGTRLSGRLIDAVWGFFFLYAVSYLAMSFVLMGIGLTPVTAFSTVATAMANIGPGLGEAAHNFATINGAALWVLSFAMILGRLEIFTVLVLFSPAFWRN